jgi:hypothetical protein
MQAGANQSVQQSSARALDTGAFRPHAIAISSLVAFAAVYIGPMMRTGWVPFDEGTLAQSAHRILLGQLPHRDFDEVYTGGLSFMHAAAFRILGENLVSLRVVLFIAVLLVVPALYYIASRFARPIIAAGISVAALISSFPSYPAGMPSWYNLILALFGCAALLRYLEVGTKRWIFIAGVCGGLSVLVKIVGLYFVAAAGLFLFFDAYALPRSSGGSLGGRRAAQTIALTIIAALAVGPFWIMRVSNEPSGLVEIALPILTVCIAVGFEVWQGRRRDDAPSLNELALLAWPFALGIAIPLACFLIPYADTRSLASLYRGLIILPQKRVTWAAEPGPPIIGMFLGLPVLYLILSPRFSSRQLRWYDGLLVISLEFALVAWSGFNLSLAASLWTVIRMSGPLAIAASAFIVARSRESGGVPNVRRAQLFLLTGAAAWCALVQFPTATYQYFLYVLPLFVLMATALTVVRGTLSRSVALATLGAFLALGLMLRPVFVAGGGSHVVLKSGQTFALLDLDRGGLVISKQERDEYVHLVATIRTHSRSPFIYVSPDAPEVYFLGGYENPTRTLFDFFDDPLDRTSRVLATIRNHNISVVVINKAPRFSGNIPAVLYDSLQVLFAEKAAIGTFEVRWRS